MKIHQLLPQASEKVIGISFFVLYLVIIFLNVYIYIYICVRVIFHKQDIIYNFVKNRTIFNFLIFKHSVQPSLRYTDPCHLSFYHNFQSVLEAVPPEVDKS